MTEIELNIRLSKDGDVWYALVGEDLLEGQSGWGQTPREALEDLCDVLFSDLPEKEE